MIGQHARARHLVGLFERDDRIEVDLLGGRLAVSLDHDRELDQAGRRHHLVGVVRERLARAQMLDCDGDLALVCLDQGIRRDSSDCDSSSVLGSPAARTCGQSQNKHRARPARAIVASWLGPVFRLVVDRKHSEPGHGFFAGRRAVVSISINARDCRIFARGDQLPARKRARRHSTGEPAAREKGMRAGSLLGIPKFADEADDETRLLVLLFWTMTARRVGRRSRVKDRRTAGSAGRRDHGLRATLPHDDARHSRGPTPAVMTPTAWSLGLRRAAGSRTAVDAAENSAGPIAIGAVGEADSPASSSACAAAAGTCRCWPASSTSS